MHTSFLVPSEQLFLKAGRAGVIIILYRCKRREWRDPPGALVLNSWHVFFALNHISEGEKMGADRKEIQMEGAGRVNNALSGKREVQLLFTI